VTAALTADLDLIDVLRAPLAVTCPKCKALPAHECESTGGGNRAYVPTHKARRDAVAGWTDVFAAEAGRLVRSVYRKPRDVKAAVDWSRFEQAAAAPRLAAKPLTPTGVRLSETQAEEIERYVLAGGYGSVSTAHFSGDARHRQTVNALEEKGIVEQAGDTDHYGRNMRLTAFGWQVYDQHPRIIKRLTDAQVAEQRARADEGRCIECGCQPGDTQGCDLCGLERFAIAENAMRAFNNEHRVGVRVRYWVGERSGDGLVSTTSDRAIFPRSVAAVRIAGEPDPVPLTHVEVLGAEVIELHARVDGGVPA
jgi:hypothetical protein